MFGIRWGVLKQSYNRAARPTRQQLGNRRFADFLPGPASQTFYIYGFRIFTSKTSAILK